MNFPNIGDIVFSYQHKDDRIGETMFLTKTQANCTPHPDEGLAEALAEVCRTGEMEMTEGEWIETINQDDAQNLIIWRMERIR